MKYTTWKGKYRSTDNTKNEKRKRKLLPKKEEISGGKARTRTCTHTHTHTHTHTWKLI